MSHYTTIHLHNVPAGSESAYAAWFDGQHRSALANLKVYKAAERYEVSEQQIMPDIPQPWRYLSVYEFESLSPAIDIPALGPLIADARKAGLIADDETERLYSYHMYSDWKNSPNRQASEPLSGVSIILANYVPGRRQEYQTWYDDVHSGEVINVPGHVAMKRGELTKTQIDPDHYCPGDQLVLCAQQTDDLLFTIKDFSARARGASPSGVTMQPRSSSGSTARTVHYFKKISGTRFWNKGIAYGGDLSVYPGKG